MASHTLQVAYDDVPAVSISKTSGAEININETIPQSSSDLEIPALTVDVSALKSLYIKANGALTLKTNSSSTPQETIVLVANSPIVWNDDLPTGIRDAIFSGDVTTLFVTEGGTADVELIIKTLQDATP